MNTPKQNKRNYNRRGLEGIQLQLKMRDSLLITVIGVLVPVIILSAICIVAEMRGNSFFGFVALGILSFVFFIEAIVIFLSCLKGSFLYGKNLRFIYPLVLFFLAIWVIRFDVALHVNLFEVENVTPKAELNIIEHILNSMVHAFQSFSMDEDYSGFLTAGKGFVLSSIKNGFLQALLSSVYGIYCAAINVLAALAGGAILLKILTNAFPGLHLRLVLSLFSSYTTYVFSELNERSILIAESVHASRPKSILVFTDAYTNESEEADVEIRMRARNIQAFCLQDDINIIKRLAWGPVKYFLIDKDEKANIISFADFFSLEKNNDFFTVWEKLNSQVEIFVFAESTMLDSMIEEFNTITEKKSLRIYAKPIDVDEIMSYDLLREHPLYRSLQEKKDPLCSKVNVLLIGDTPLIKHFIKNACWCGQFLNPYGERFPDTDTPVRVHPAFYILCKDKDNMESFIKINLNKLRYRKKNTELTYAEFEVHEAKKGFEVLIEDHFMNSLSGGFNYCLVDTGDDLENLSLSRDLKQRLDIQYLLTEQTADILCMVRDPELNSINNQLTGPNAAKPEKMVRRCYVGSFAEQYQIDNIEHSELEMDTFEIHQAGNEDDLWEDLYKNMYNYRSSRASALHYQYRLFSAGVFPDWEGEGKWSENKYTQNYLYRILEIPMDDKQNKLTVENVEISKQQREYLNLLFWLEKIRWNAYMYSIGYREPTCREMSLFYKKYNSYELHKNREDEDEEEMMFTKEPLHLHGCLMDLLEPIGIPLEIIKYDNQMKKEYDTIRARMQEDFLKTDPLSWPENKTWPDYLKECYEKYWEEFCIKHGIRLDIIDIFSAFFDDKDYKNYDFSQVPKLGINRLIRHLPEEEREQWLQGAVQQLSALGTEGNYLWNMMNKMAKYYKKELTGTESENPVDE